ncbi:NAD-glutamate dehydrogenase [Legionella impletisoli]|uniref:NAD-glutamate dehydrogenase n=3 Tax=Bacteria TaxID=2 RepID=A0A917NA61_9GAMM|nr:NAD-glutamate dehydrogenase [Legionella impletisoli]GGI77029.1 NAD-glutamate dehydrogenase [Legionella impletisoli]
MSYKFEEGKDQILNVVVKKIKSKLNAQQAKLCSEFFLEFFGTVALDDLQEWSTDDLYGAAINYWHLLQSREPEEIKIRIYNPEFERHGWQTTHTVIEIISDDMPFLVDSIRMAVNRMGLSSHLIIHLGGLHIERNNQNEITSISSSSSKRARKSIEDTALIYMEIDRQTDPQVLDELYKHLERVLEDNRLAVEDWMAMRERVRDIIHDLEHAPKSLDLAEVEETKAFLNWIEDHHFTFLGIRDYEIVQKGKETILQAIPDTGLGVLSQGLSKSSVRSISAMTPEARELTLSSRILVMSKTNTLSSVHRDAYTDYIGVKRFDKKGKVIGERRIIGLYTSAAYNTNPKHIPFLRHKVAQIMKNSKLHPRSHAGKVLLNILETLPRDDLIQASEDELLEIGMGIFHMQERRRIRMFARTDVYRRFISCLVYVPRDRFNTELRQEMQEVLSEAFHAKEVTFSTRFSESVLARIHFIIRIDPKETPDIDFKEVEKQLIEIGRSWTDDLHQNLKDAFGEEKANQIFSTYKNAFPAVYKTNFAPRTAVFDIKHIEQLSAENILGMNFYRPLDNSTDTFRLKMYQHDTTIAISDVLPIIENLGLRAITERPYALKFGKGKVTWINDFILQYTNGSAFDFDEIRDLFQKAFTHIWFNDAENDGFNQLVLGASLDWRQVSVLRTYAKYFKQIGITFSQDYIISALNNNASLAKKLINLFELHFSPKEIENREKQIHALVAEILTDLDSVENLDEDKIIRQYVQAITSTLRTNFYQVDEDGKPKSYISIKLNSKTIAGVPRPHPMFEIFVYSPRLEGVHLRCGRVARGGIRWSDRKEDFRTEILGLMKAQQVKNAVIVPSGAKGGFVAKQLPLNGTREEIQEEGINCYRLFIRGLLDITDNYKNKKIVKPDNVVCYDEDDPYLVVAADKGTATFSDIANELSQRYGFWLGDAFASGGSIGYDHKKMGITAKGAWESVKRHFYEIGIDVQTTDFTVVGIGDMAGDVFGNGMLLSKHIKLVAAFNHMHIFIDPNPDPKTSYKERERLFKLSRSTWADYDKKLISKGGGVFNRSAKSITLTKEIRDLLGIKQTSVEPNELIRMILQAKVDLLWSAGIGTFVKARSETNQEVGDRTNDGIRINAKQLNCRVVGEGGNLGLTQLARVEYSLNGGLIYTDFIDNSGGVSCSDKEVNIKILLDMIVRGGDLTEKQRNELLVEMTDEVSRLVLRENNAQTRALSMMEAQAARSVELHSRYINELERTGKIDRSLEFLPEEKVLMERKQAGRGLSSPGMAVLFCYSKIILKEAILASDVPEDSFLNFSLIRSFPIPLRERFSEQMQSHPLKREIIATSLSNTIINEMGFTFVFRMQDETGAPISAIVRAFMIARAVMDMDSVWKRIDTLENKIPANTQADIMLMYVRLLRRMTRWFLRSQRKKLDISKTVELCAPGVQALKQSMPEVFGATHRAKYDDHLNEYLAMGIGKELAHELTITRGMFAALDIIDIAHELGVKIPKVAETYFNIGEYLELAWIRTQVIIHPTDNHWEALSREALRDDLDWQQRQLTYGIIQLDGCKKDFFKCFNSWSEKHAALIERWRHVLGNLRSSSTLNYTMFFVATRELLDLTQTTVQAQLS